MIKIIDGNLLDATENVIGHQVNCRGVMGAGVAKALVEKYPQIFDVYKELCDWRGVLNLGSVNYVYIEDGRLVANLFGQAEVGRGLRTDYRALEIALTSLKRFAIPRDWTIALPYKIGCNLAGGDWDGVVYPMIEKVFNDYDITLYRYDPKES